MTPEKLTDEERELQKMARLAAIAGGGGREREKFEPVFAALVSARTRADTLERERDEERTARAEVEAVLTDALDGATGEWRELYGKLQGKCIAAEERATALTVERDALRDALMVAVRRANDCIRGCRVLPDGGVGWGAGVCVCAKEASDAVKSFTVRAPPAGGEKL